MYKYILYNLASSATPSVAHSFSVSLSLVILALGGLSVLYEIKTIKQYKEREIPTDLNLNID
jgi:hypothetical protein